MSANPDRERMWRAYVADRSLRLQRSQAASHWRVDHADDSDRERLWRAFRTGALRGIGALGTQTQHAIRAGLDDAERAVPFP